MLSLFAVMALVLILPLLMYVSTAVEDLAGVVAATPYIWLAAILGWFFWGIWVPFAVFGLVALLVFGAHLDKKQKILSGTTIAPLDQSGDGLQPDAEYGEWAKFEYADRDGVITNRHIVSWYKDPPYIKGWDLDQKAHRTFREDRVNDWLAG